MTGSRYSSSGGFLTTCRTEELRLVELGQLEEESLNEDDVGTEVSLRSRQLSMSSYISLASGFQPMEILPQERNLRASEETENLRKWHGILKDNMGAWGKNAGNNSTDTAYLLHRNTTKHTEKSHLSTSKQLALTVITS